MDNYKKYNAPKFLIGLSLLFWGVCIDEILIAVTSALLVETAHFVKNKWELKTDDYIKISDLNSIILISAIVIIIANVKPKEILVTLAMWLPIIHFPLIAAQAYSTKSYFIIGTKFGFGKNRKTYMHKPFNISYAYFALVLFSAASGNTRTVWFFPVLFLFIAISIYKFRASKTKIYTWFILIFITLGISFKSQQVVEKTHLYLRKKSMQWWLEYMQKYWEDPYKSSTGIGDIGNLKLSGEIIMRVKADKNPPDLLRNSAYNIFVNNSWFSRNKDFKQISPSAPGYWKIQKENKSHQVNTIFIEKPLNKNRGLLTMPYGTIKVEDLNVSDLLKNNMGTVKIEEGAETVEYTITYQIGGALNSQPVLKDKIIPKDELETIEKIIKSLDLDSKSDEEKIERIKNYFGNFKYTLNLKGKGKYKTALSRFLLDKKAGHCEYFATAATLLLRKAGFPSRYVTGFSLYERNPYDGNFVVRNRHSHSWSEVFFNGKWEKIDTTPSVWLFEDEREKSIFEPISDFISYAKYRYNKYMRSRGKTENKLMIAVLIFLSSILLLRIYLGKKRKKNNKNPQVMKKNPIEYVKSPFNEVTNLISKYELNKDDDETNREWLIRIEKTYRNQDKNIQILTVNMEKMIRLHNKFRFYPPGISEKEKIELISLIKSWKENECNID